MKRSLLFCCLLLSFSVYAQRVVTGRVIDAKDGSPLPLASIACKGARSAASTNMDGLFSITISSQCRVLMVTYIGYATQEIAVPDSAKLLYIYLQKNVLEEASVVVTGYGGKSRKYISGSVGQLVQDRAINNDRHRPIQENRFTNTACQPVSTFGADVDKASYSYLRRNITAHTIPGANAVKVEEMINYFDYDYAQPTGKAPYAIHTELTQCPWNTRHQLMRVALQGRRNPQTIRWGNNFVFLIDVSGSMHGDDRLGLVKQSFGLLLKSLQRDDMVSIVTYAGSSGLVLDATPASDTTAIIKALQRLQAGGSTAGGKGIELAYATARKYFINGGNNRVILATDGDFNVGVSSYDELLKLIEKERESGVFLTCLGFGTGNYKDDTMELLADKGNGNYFYIDQIGEAQRVLQKDFNATMNTIAKDVKIQVEFNSRFVQGYRLIGYENRLLAKEDFTNDIKDAGEIGEGHTVTVLYEIIPTGITDSLLDKAPDSNRCENGLFTAESNTLAAVRTRYKLPDSRKSQPLDFFVLSNPVPFTAASANTRWAASIAMFGMLLRESPYSGNATTQLVIETATKAMQPGNAVQQEFLQLAGMYRNNML